MPSSRRVAIAAAVVATLTAWALPAFADEAGGDPDDESSGFLDVAFALSAEFDLEVEDVQELHEMGIGFGAMFLLQGLSQAQDQSVWDTIIGMTGEDGTLSFGFGKLRRSLDEAQLAILEGLPKNLGQLISASHRPDHAGKPDHAGSKDKPAEDDDSGGGDGAEA